MKLILKGTSARQRKKQRSGRNREHGTGQEIFGQYIQKSEGTFRTEIKKENKETFAKGVSEEKVEKQTEQDTSGQFVQKSKPDISDTYRKKILIIVPSAKRIIRERGIKKSTRAAIVTVIEQTPIQAIPKTIGNR